MRIFYIARSLNFTLGFSVQEWAVKKFTMAIPAIRAFSESLSDFKVIRKEVLISLVEEDFWSTQYSLSMPTSNDGTDRIQVTCFFRAEEAYFLSHDRQILPLSSEVSPPYPVGCILWIREGGILHQVDLPKYPYLRLHKLGDSVTAHFVVQDRYGSGLILWGANKLSKLPIKETIYVRVNRLRSLEEAVWLEPYPHGALSAICLTDHPDYDSVAKIRLLYELFSENNLRITKGVFPSSDPELGRTEPGIDVPEYKTYIDMLYENGSEIAYHGLSPRNHPPPLSECLRRIDLMSMYSPKTWIDHGCGDYLFSKNAVFKEGASLVEILSKVGVENYWSYSDVWENPARTLNVWTKRKLLFAFSNVFSFLWDKKRMSAPLLLYYGSTILKNLLGPFHLRPIMDKPWRVRAWKSVTAQARRLKYYHENPMVLYDLSGQCSFMSNQRIWVFDTILLNHLAFQLRPANVDLLCKQSGLLLAHCYFGHQKHRYGTINCFVNDGANLSLIPEFIENVRYISEKQTQRELVSLSFNALRNALNNFVNASLIHTSSGWEIKGVKAILASQRPTSVSGPNRGWCKGKLHYTEVEGESVVRVPC
jgi:hypothetical protein